MHKSKSLFTFFWGTPLRQNVYIKKEKKSKMEEELNCPVCLDYFKSPVRITPCGHNYCQACLTGMLAIPWLCPECRTEIHQRPEQLARNFFLERTVKNYVESRRNICGVHDLSKKLRKYFKRFQIVRFRYQTDF